MMNNLFKYTLKSPLLLLSVLVLVMLIFAACEKNHPEPELEQPKPALENLELGLGNAGIGVIGEDFHFEDDILAVDKIDKVDGKILPKEGETYSKTWKHEITLDQYKGLKNANIHKHFNIPDDASEGKYELLVIVYEENGSKLEMKEILKSIQGPTCR